MDRASVDRLRFDRRLEHRRGWVAGDDRTTFVDNLPDVSDKMTRGFDDPEEEAAEGQAAESPAAPAFGGEAAPADSSPFSQPPPGAQGVPAAQEAPSTPPTPPTPAPFGSPRGSSGSFPGSSENS